MMRRRGLLVCLVSSLFGVLGCSVKKMPEGELLRVKYSRHAARAGAEYEGLVERDSTGAYILKAMQTPYGPLFQKQLDATEVQQFCQIIQKEKMYQYKDIYTPMMRVLDGYSWSFYAKFSDGSSISTHGENARPKGEGLARIRNLMTELAKEGIQIEKSETP